MFIGDDTSDLIYDPSEAPLLHRAFPAVRSPSFEKRNLFLKFNDVKILDGPFTEKEDKRIIRNYNKFLKCYKIEDSTATRCGLLGFALEDPDHEETVSLVKQLVKPCGFYFRLAEKMPNRLIAAVVARARKLLTPFRKQKEISLETQLEIREYAKSIGDMENLYAHIANKFDCDPAAARRIVLRKADISKDIDFRMGRWTKKESARLLNSVCLQLNIDPKDITTQILLTAEISWTQVAKDVRTRCNESCRKHVTTMFKQILPEVRAAVIKKRLKKEKS